MNIYEKITDLIVLILILFLFPAIYLSKKSELLTYQAITREAEAFQEDIETKGMISRERYEQFCLAIYAYGEPLRIELIYEVNVQEPAYAIDKTSNRPVFLGRIYEYTRVIETEEIIHYMDQAKTDYPLMAGGYFELHIIFTDQKYEAVYLGGTIRAVG